MATRPQVIALEEHYLDPEVKPYITGSDVTRQPKVSARLDDGSTAEDAMALNSSDLGDRIVVRLIQLAVVVFLFGLISEQIAAGNDRA